MRLKRIKGAEQELFSSAYVVSNPESNIGNYKLLFDNYNPIHLEIGMGKGDFIIGMAKKYPNINFIGLEKYASVQYKALKKLELENLNNVKLISFDANEIETIFSREIDILYLNFSDPWPKNKHEKRRLTHEKFLSKYDLIFKENLHIIQKTDNRSLFEFSLKSLTDFGYKIETLSLDLYDTDLKDNIATEYETKFNKKGFKIYKAEYIKKV